MNPLRNKYDFPLRRNFARNRISIFIVLLSVSGYQFVSAGEKLPTGKWSGEFVTHDEVLYSMEYRVSYEGDSNRIGIKMINLKLGASKFTDILSEIEVDDKRLSFKIKRKFETKDCKLELDNGVYRGRCTSDAGKEGEFSTITMVPPSAAEDIEHGEKNEDNDPGKKDKNKKNKKTKKKDNSEDS